jgi:chromosomal replication initiation ATPase DnaA
MPMPSRRPLTFDTFVTTAGSRAALDACLAAASADTTGPHSFVLAGPSGCGKTHLLCALAARVSGGAGSDAGIAYTTAYDLRARLVLALRLGQATEGLLARPGARLVVIDDLHTLRECPGTQEALARAWASAVRSGISVVAGLSGSDEALRPLRDAIGAVAPRWINLQPPTQTDAMRIFDTLVRAHRLTPDGASTRRMLADWNGDVRRLIGAAAHAALAAREQRPSVLPPWMRSA